MRMTLHTDYALRMLIFLAVRNGRPCTVSDVASAYGLSRNHLIKVAQGLSELGLVETLRGRAGGIRLARLPEEINVGFVVRAMEDDKAMVECLKTDGGACTITPSCRLTGIVREALAAYLCVFDKYLLCDLVRNRQALASLLGMAGPPEDGMARGEAGSLAAAHEGG